MEISAEVLKQFGFTDDEIEQIDAYYRSDSDGVVNYARFVRVMFDDRREYVD